MKTLTHIPVDSSMLAAVAYDKESKTLFVEFNTRKIWAYEGVPERTFEALLKANSVGRFMRGEVLA